MRLYTTLKSIKQKLRTNLRKRLNGFGLIVVESTFLMILILSVRNMELFMRGRLPIVACQNPPASGDGQHGRAGKSLGRLGSWFLRQRPANFWHVPRVLVLAGVPPDLYLIRKVMDCFRSFPAW